MDDRLIEFRDRGLLVALRVGRTVEQRMNKARLAAIRGDFKTALRYRLAAERLQALLR